MTEEKKIQVFQLLPTKNMYEMFYSILGNKRILNNVAVRHACGCIYTLIEEKTGYTYFCISCCMTHKVTELIRFEFLLRDISRFGMNKLRKERINNDRS